MLGLGWKRRMEMNQSLKQGSFDFFNLITHHRCLAPSSPAFLLHLSSIYFAMSQSAQLIAMSLSNTYDFYQLPNKKNKVKIKINKMVHSLIFALNFTPVSHTRT
jgi:hypothetical protein